MAAEKRQNRARKEAARDEVLFGTMDCWLIWKLTGGPVHATDVSNASRTMLLNLKTLDWDAELLKLIGVPRAMLPDVRDSAGDFGTTRVFGRAIPILGVAGDQQAASIGQACLLPGDVKSTYGTGCFVLVNTADKIVHSKNRLLATSLYRRGATRQYAIEVCIFFAGAVVLWLRDELEVLPTAPASEAWQSVPSRRMGFISCPPSPAWARPGIGRSSRAARSWGSPVTAEKPRSCAPRWTRCVSKPATPGSDGRRYAPRRPEAARPPESGWRDGGE